MDNQWDQNRIEQYISSKIEESTTIEYKGAAALGRGEIKEIAKDVSGMANASGGYIFYGIKEYDDRDNKHKPEMVDPVDRIQYSKEWIEQIINSNIEPLISNIIIHPVQINTGPNHVVYVIEIPQSTTAHQVTANKDYRYYIRMNFQTIPMEDFLVRDVMNRANKPSVSVIFHYIELNVVSDQHNYFLGVKIVNKGHLLVNNYKLVFSFPDIVNENGKSSVGSAQPNENVKVINKHRGCFDCNYNSVNVLFPMEEVEVGYEIRLKYSIDDYIYDRLDKYPPIKWTLYADDMLPKSGTTIIPNNY